ncbi:hypothetical protein [Candidatus Viridilinea mediisalina]|uniref:Glycosyltransferase RgtA/B/C/D-like domain-containing protein n=1 Tax=Candidatus Viridilinea mediisalina TaxID=2024553 RepID=A0A2A6RP34_9CHLR|nr:hypothetical protein [Candidatus Viridilinea mediisalina]PDW04629.1 hypothetical protein CJ255_02305 [Candidatus Viridilinea mediisalina]
MRRPLLIFFLLLISYAYVLPRWSDWNQNSRLNLVLAMVDDGTVKIDRYVANTGDYAIYEGHAYTDKPPGLSLMAVPVYHVLSPLLNLPVVEARLAALGGGAAFAQTLQADGAGLGGERVRFALVQYVLTLAVVATSSAGLGVGFFLALQRLEVAPGPAAFGALAFGLATSAAPYAGNFYGHQLVAALLFGAFYVAWPHADSAVHGATRLALRPMWDPRALLCGLLLGWAVISEYPAVLPGSIIGLYALWVRGLRWLTLLVLGGIIPLILLVTYDLIAFGTPLPIGYAHSALWQDQHTTGFMSITYPQLDALVGLTFGAFRGLFFRAPWLLLAMPGLVIWWRSGRWRAEWWVLLLASLSLLLFYGSSMMWWGGFAAGPRYIVPLIPFLALPAAWLMAQLWAKLRLRLVSVGLVVLSLLLVWIEATARQLFPTDALRNTWTGYVFPAWLEGDIARNLGMALGLSGPWSLLPLLGLIIFGTIMLLRDDAQVLVLPQRRPLQRRYDQ